MANAYAFTLHEALTTKPCIGCERIAPSLHFMVKTGEGLGQRWDPIDVCHECAGKLTAEDVHHLATASEPEAA